MLARPDDVQVRLERLFSKNVGKHTLPIFVHCNCTNSNSKISKLATSIARTLYIDCECLITPYHLLGRLAEKLFGIQRRTAADICSVHSFLEICRKYEPRTTTLVLGSAHSLLIEDPMVLWTIIHLKTIMPDYELPLRIVMVSTKPVAGFSRVLDGIVPLIISDFVKEDFIETVLKSTCPADVKEESYRGILLMFVASYPPFERLPSPETVPDLVVANLLVGLDEDVKLYYEALKPMTALANGESLRAISTELVTTLTMTEKYLLLAAYIASHNPAKFDLRLFGGAGKRARVSRQLKVSVKASKFVEKLPRVIQERLLELYQREKSTPESMEWFNLLIGWLFDQMRDTPAVKEAFFFRPLAESAVDMRRKFMGFLLREALLEQLVIGDSLPQLNGLRMISDGRGSTPLTLAGEFSYDGGMTGLLRLETIAGLQLWLAGRLLHLHGTLFIVIQESSMHIGFSQISRLETEARALIAGREWPWLNWILGTIWMPIRFRRKYLMPKMKDKWLLNQPSRPPYPWDPDVKSDPDLLYNWTPSDHKD